MSLMPQGSEILEDMQEDQDEYFDRLGVYNSEPRIIDGQEIRIIDGQEFRVIMEDVVSHETLETVTRERLIPIFDLNDQGEDDETIFNDTRQGPVINSTITMGSVSISETEIDHPVVITLMSDVSVLARSIGQQQEQLNRQQDRIERLEEKIERQDDINQGLIDVIKEMKDEI